MQIFHNPVHDKHAGRQEMFRGKLVPCHETPARLEYVLDALRQRGIGDLLAPSAPDLALIKRVHTPRYVDFLASAWQDWVALDPANADIDILPSVWPVRGFRHDIEPTNFAARVGLFSFDSGCPLTAGTWEAATAGAACAIDAALAAQALRDAGAERVAVLDVDYHHGNGTQSIFYERGDVLTVSIHGDPTTEYPFFLGYADEHGQGAGLGANLNLPLPAGTDFATWTQALRQGLSAIQAFKADAVVIALGVDTYEGDPISKFKLKSVDYLEVGRKLASLGLPAVFTMEGGYAVADVGINVANVLEGYGR